MGGLFSKPSTPRVQAVAPIAKPAPAPTAVSADIQQQVQSQSRQLLASSTAESNVTASEQATTAKKKLLG